jgi:hypothetical protein
LDSCLNRRAGGCESIKLKYKNGVIQPAREST